MIYVCGGNTFYLLYKIQESGFDKIIKQFVESGKLYFGVSAGSYVVCPTIEMAYWKHPDRNDVGLEDLTGLSIVPFLITVHFEPKYTQDIKKSIDSAAVILFVIICAFSKRTPNILPG